MKRVLASFFILLIAAAVVFFIGWVQFDIKPGECGIMVSKTGGTLERPLLPGKFEWRWERILPTNVTMHKFKLEPYKSSQRYEGKLPGSDLYSKMLENSPDFSYELELSVQISPTAEGLVSLVEKNIISSQEDLNAYLENKAKVISTAVADSLLPDENSRTSRSYHSLKALDKTALERLIKEKSSDLEAVALYSVEIINAKIPDMESYSNTKVLYENYKAEIEKALKAKAGQYADEMNEQEKSVVLLEKYAELLKKYPQLKDLEAINEVSKTLKKISPSVGEDISSVAEGLAAVSSEGETPVSSQLQEDGKKVSAE